MLLGLLFIILVSSKWSLKDVVSDDVGASSKIRHISLEVGRVEYLCCCPQKVEEKGASGGQNMNCEIVTRSESKSVRRNSRHLTYVEVKNNSNKRVLNRIDKSTRFLVFRTRVMYSAMFPFSRCSTTRPILEDLTFPLDDELNFSPPRSNQKSKDRCKSSSLIPFYLLK